MQACTPERQTVDLHDCKVRSGGTGTLYGPSELSYNRARDQAFMWCHLHSGLMLKQVFCLQLVPTGLTMLYTMTEREADNFGIFYREVLSTVKGWWVSSCLFTVYYNFPHSTTDTALTAAAHCAWLREHMHWTRVHRPKVCDDTQFCISSASGIYAVHVCNSSFSWPCIQCCMQWHTDV